MGCRTQIRNRISFQQSFDTSHFCLAQIDATKGQQVGVGMDGQVYTRATRIDLDGNFIQV